MRRSAEKLLGKADSDMALIADVHTDANSEQVLEEAVGRPLLSTMVVPQADGPVTYHGAAFSYYEFKQPMNDRLTDEAWQTRLAAPDSRPHLPAWCPSQSSDRVN